MKIISEERSTGMGATRFSAVLEDGKFVKVSKLDNARYLGRNAGVEEFEVEVPDGAIWGKFYRSNSGKEEVEIFAGEAPVQEFWAFDEAHRWASEQKAGTIIVTRHPSLVDYLLEIGLIDGNAQIITGNVTPGDVLGKHVIGILPNWIACHAASLTEVPLVVPTEMRGKELTLDQVREYATTPVTYIITKQ